MDEDRDVFIGRLDGRLGALESTVGTLRSSVDTGFAAVHRRLDELYAAENQRKGILQAVKTLFTGGLLTALWEAGRRFFSGHG